MERIIALWGDFALQMSSGMSIFKKTSEQTSNQKTPRKKQNASTKHTQTGMKPDKTEFMQNMLLLELPKLLQSISQGCDCFRCCLILISLGSLSHPCLINLWEEGVSP